MGASIKDLANAKGLPEEFLRGCRVTEEKENILIPYRQLDGGKARTRRRTALSAKEGSTWQVGEEAIIPYGLWLVARMAKSREGVLIVEGESDCWTLWYHKIPALGIPGATMCDKLQLEHVEPFQVVYIWQEPDESGAGFASDVRDRLLDVGYAGHVYLIRATNIGSKDPNELYCKDPDSFLSAMEAACVGSEQLDLWPEPKLPVMNTVRATFPTHVLSDPSATFVPEVARAIGCDESFVGPFVLTAEAVAISGSHVVKVKQGWQESTNLYVAVVSRPGGGKSPALDAAVKPLEIHHDRLKEEGKKAGELYKKELAHFNKANKRGIDDTLSEPNQPPRLRLIVTDGTGEGFGRDLQDNLRGILLKQDELSAWARRVNQYRGGIGADRQFYLSCWSRSMHETSRKTATEAHVRNPHLTVMGGIPPEVIGEQQRDKWLIPLTKEIQEAFRTVDVWVSNHE